MFKPRALTCFLALNLFLFAVETAGPITNAEAGPEMITISGKITRADGEPALPPTTVAAQEANGFSLRAIVDSNGNYSLTVPPTDKLRLAIIVGLADYNRTSVSQADVGFSNYISIISAQTDTTLDFKLPKPINISITVVDGKNQPVSNSKLVMVNTNQPHLILTTQDGNSWTGIQRWNQNAAPLIGDKTGKYSIWYYPTDSFSGIIATTSDGKIGTALPAFPLTNDVSFKMCLPINLSSSKKLPADCSTTSPVQLKSSIKASATPTPAPSLLQNSSADSFKIAKLTSQLAAVTKCLASAKSILAGTSKVPLPANC